MQKKLLILLTFVLLSLLSDRFIFTSHSYKTELEPKFLNTDLNSEVELEIYRINLLGFRVPFSKPDVLFTTENENLISILQIESNKAIITSKGITGEAVVIIYSSENLIELKRVLIPVFPPPSALILTN